MPTDGGDGHEEDEDDLNDGDDDGEEEEVCVCALSAIVHELQNELQHEYHRLFGHIDVTILPGSSDHLIQDGQGSPRGWTESGHLPPCLPGLHGTRFSQHQQQQQSLPQVLGPMESLTEAENFLLGLQLHLRTRVTNAGQRWLPYNDPHYLHSTVHGEVGADPFHEITDPWTRFLCVQPLPDQVSSFQEDREEKEKRKNRKQ